MFGQSPPQEDSIEKQEKNLSSLEKRMEELDEKTNELLDDFKLDKESTQEEFDKTDSLSEEEQAFFSKLQDALKSRITKEIDQVPNIERTERAFKELGLADQNWIRM